MATTAIRERSTTSGASWRPALPPTDAPRRSPGPPAGNAGRPSDRAARLAQLPFFASLREQELTELAATCQVRRYRPGQVLFYAGDPGHALYLIQSGSVKIVGEAADGQETILHLAGPGECLGELALLDEEPRSATVVALGRVEVLLLQREAFLELLERRPGVARAVMGELARRVRQLNEQLQESRWRDLPGRIAQGLLLLAEEQGRVTPEGIRIPVRLTLLEWGQWVGAARATVCTELGRLRERGIVSLDGEGMTLHQPERLRRSLG